MNFGAVFANWQIFWTGLLVTVQLSVIAIVLGTVFGTSLALLRTLEIRVVSLGVQAFVAVFRGTPLLMQLFFAYYGLPFLGIHLDALTTATLTLGAYSGAYISEIVFGGISVVPGEQRDAARAIGLTSYQMMRRVILPQAILVILPPLFSWYIGVIKDTTLTSVIGYSDLLRRAGGVVAVTGLPFEVYLVTAACYWVLTLPLGRMVARLEARAARGWG